MNYAGIQTRFYELTKTNSTSMPAANLNSYIQPSEDRVWSLILQADGRWQWDDSNNTDFPIATFDLVASQADYAFAATQLKLIGVSVKDKGGTFRKLAPVDPQDFGDIDRTTHVATAGMPSEYDVLGNSAILYPAPDNGVNVTLTGGGKFYFQRAGKHFDYSVANGGSYAAGTAGTFTDTTGSYASTPGFNSLYHDLIPLWAAYDYCIINLPQLANGYLAEIQRKEQQMILDYSKRNKDDRVRLTMNPVNFE